MAYPAGTLYPRSSGLYPGDGADVPPTVTTGAATSIGSSYATIAGSVNPNGLSTHYYFEYGFTGSYGLVSSTTNVGSGLSAVAASRDLTGLASGRHYNFRLVAYNSAGFGYGANAVFETTVDDLAEFLHSDIHGAGRGQ